MRKIFFIKLTAILITGFLFMPASKIFSQGTGQGMNTDGYGSYGMMGQDPDEILNYGRKMMRYGFHEGTAGGSNKYPGYGRYLSDETVNKLNAEQSAFIRETEDLRQTIYEKELYLKVELSKKAPDSKTALGFQKELSEARGNFEQKMIQHLIRMKKINLEAYKSQGSNE